MLTLMTSTLVLSFLTFAFVASITPGPNNIMLMASGANFGFRQTLPHLAGVTLGFVAMAALVGVGLAGVFAAAPWLYEILRWVGASYLVFLAYKVATARGLSSGNASGRPMTFLQAAAFQWVNPKAWSMVLGAVTSYAPPNPDFSDIAFIALLFFMAGAPCAAAWTVFGVGMKTLLAQPNRMRVFNVAMAALLMISLYPLFMDIAGVAATGE